MSKISYMQLAVTSYVTRLFTEMANLPSDAINYGPDRFWTILFAKLIVMLAYLPMIFVTIRFPEDNFITAAIRRSKAFGWVLGIVFILAVVLEIMVSLLNLEPYINDTVLSNVSYGLVLVLVLLVCLYAVFKGVQAISRTAVIILVLFGLLLIAMLITLGRYMDFVYLYPSFIENKENFVNSLIQEFSNNSELFIFAVVCAYVREKPAKSIFVYMPAMLVILELINLMYNLVLGPYVETVEYPFYMLASLSDIVIFQRLDGIDVVLWITTSVVKLSLLLFCCGEVIRNLTGKLTSRIFITVLTVAIAISGTIIGVNVTVTELLRSIILTGIPLLTGGVVIPLVVLIFGKKKEGVESEKTAVNSAD